MFQNCSIFYLIWENDLSYTFLRSSANISHSISDEFSLVITVYTINVVLIVCYFICLYFTIINVFFFKKTPFNILVNIYSMYYGIIYFFHLSERQHSCWTHKCGSTFGVCPVFALCVASLFKR